MALGISMTGACGQLVALTLQHLPRDRKPGSLRRYEKGERIWAPEDFADRVYFLKTGQVVIKTSKIQGRDFVLQLVQVQHPFGELCCCSAAGDLRHSAAYAVTESAAIEISLNGFLQYLKAHQDACLAPLSGLPVEKPIALTLLQPPARSPYGSSLSQAHEWSPGDSDAPGQRTERPYVLGRYRWRVAGPQPHPRRRPHRLHARTTRRSPPASVSWSGSCRFWR
jgi:hypothetical protein